MYLNGAVMKRRQLRSHLNGIVEMAGGDGVEGTPVYERHRRPAIPLAEKVCGRRGSGVGGLHLIDQRNDA